jgi:hypothetical protein
MLRPACLHSEPAFGKPTGGRSEVTSKTGHLAGTVEAEAKDVELIRHLVPPRKEKMVRILQDVKVEQ